jgi:hypothetical protein
VLLRSTGGELVVHRGDGRIAETYSYAAPEGKTSIRSGDKTAPAYRTHVLSDHGEWIVTSPQGEIGRFRTKSEAEVAARSVVKKRGGGEVVVHGRDGRIRELDSYGKSSIGRQIKDPPRGGRLSKSEIRDAVWNGSRSLRKK